MLEKIIETLAKHTDYDKEKMNRDTSFVMDLNLNSIEVMQLVLEFEEEYDIEFPEERLVGITTIGELEDLINDLVEE